MEAGGITPPAWIMDYSETINNYATKTRYGTNLVAVKRKLHVIKAHTAIYLQQLTAKQVGQLE